MDAELRRLERAAAAGDPVARRRWRRSRRRAGLSPRTEGSSENRDLWRTLRPNPFQQARLSDVDWGWALPRALARLTWVRYEPGGARGRWLLRHSGTWSRVSRRRLAFEIREEHGWSDRAIGHVLHELRRRALAASTGAAAA